MPCKEERKITSTGNVGAVVIPKPMRDYFELKPGDKITILYDSLLVAIPEKVKDIIVEKKELIDKLLR